MDDSAVDLRVYPDECDTFGHLNQASFLTLFERARWEMLARGPGMSVFTREGAWPVVRKATIEYCAPVFPGDMIQFRQSVLHVGRTSFVLQQTARRVDGGSTVATAEFVFVCVDRNGTAIPVPGPVVRLLQGGASGPETPARVPVNGLTLAVETRGEGPAVLFVHGYPLDRSIWQHQMESLKGWRRIAPDLRGMGSSDAPDLGYSMSTYAADLIALLDSLQIQQVVCCGISMGGYVAFEMLRAARHRIRALILIATRAEADSAEARKARDAALSTAREGGARAIAESMLPKLLSSRAPEEVRNRLRTQMEALPVAGITGALVAMRDRVDSTPLLATLSDLPTLVLAGESDELMPLTSITRMVDAIPGAVLRVVPNSGHLPPVEQPAATTQIIQDFLDTLTETDRASQP